MRQVARHIRRFLGDELGATAIEYGLVASLIAIAIIVSAGLLGTNLNSVFETLNTTMAPPQ